MTTSSNRPHLKTRCRNRPSRLKPAFSSTRPEAGEAKERLLSWVARIESDSGVEVKEIFWNRAREYWLEINGERVPHDEPLAPLEFPE